MAANVERGECDQGVGAGEPEGHSGDEPDLGVDRFDQSVGQPYSIEARISWRWVLMRLWSWAKESTRDRRAQAIQLSSAPAAS